MGVKENPAWAPDLVTLTLGLSCLIICGGILEIHGAPFYNQGYTGGNSLGHVYVNSNSGPGSFSYGYSLGHGLAPYHYQYDTRGYPAATVPLGYSSSSYYGGIPWSSNAIQSPGRALSIPYVFLLTSPTYQQEGSPGSGVTFPQFQPPILTLPQIQTPFFLLYPIVDPNQNETMKDNGTMTTTEKSPSESEKPKGQGPRTKGGRSDAEEEGHEAKGSGVKPEDEDEDLEQVENSGSGGGQRQGSSSAKPTKKNGDNKDGKGEGQGSTSNSKDDDDTTDSPDSSE